MGLFIQQDERTELQKKLAAELQDRARERSKLANMPDGVDDSQYIKGTKKTTTLSWAWMAIVIAVVIIVVWLMTLV
jgi:type VI protein secretion system component VasF